MFVKGFLFFWKKIILQNWLHARTVNSSYFITIPVCSVLYFHPESVGVPFPAKSQFKACLYLKRNKRKWSLFFIITVYNNANCIRKHKCSSKTLLYSVYSYASECACVCMITICTKHVCYHIWLTSLPLLNLVYTCTLILPVSEAELGKGLFLVMMCLQQWVIGG